MIIMGLFMMNTLNTQNLSQCVIIYPGLKHVWIYYTYIINIYKLLFYTYLYIYIYQGFVKYIFQKHYVRFKLNDLNQQNY